MVACLIAIPAAALFGTSLPDIVKKVIDARWPASHAPARQTPCEAPTFGPVAVAAAPSEPLRLDRNFNNAPGSLPGGENLRVEQLRPMDGASAVPVPPSAGIAASYDSPLDRPDYASVASATGGPIGSRPGGLPPGDQFDYVEKRLRQLGATYYLLESWGGQRQLYRFYCRMAIGGSSNYTRYFEATDADALGAMGKVLAEVEAWRRGTQ
jgi:hypothetical protein